MSSDLLDAYGRTLAFVSARVAGTSDAQFADPTPCSDWDVEALLAHITTVIHHYTALASGQAREAISFPPALAGGAPRDVLPVLVSAALAAWAQPGALEDPCAHVMGKIPGSRALSIHVTDLLLHGWDLSVATGQDATLDPALAELALATLRDVLLLDDGRGRFWAPALTAHGSDVQSRLLAYSGRSWPRPAV